MEIEISTPALLFPAISLLILAYTNRFLTTGQLIRSISHQSREHGGQDLSGQIENLKKKPTHVCIIRWNKRCCGGEGWA